MKNTLYAGVNEYGYIFPTTIRATNEESADALCSLMKIENTEKLSLGVQVIEYTQDGFVAPLFVNVQEGTTVTVVKGWKAGYSYIAKTNKEEPK